MPKKNKNESSEQEQNKFVNLRSMERVSFNYEAKWLTLIHFPMGLKAVYNALLILEIIFAQLIIPIRMNTDQAMQSEIHRTGTKITNLPEFLKFFTAVATDMTNRYAGIVKNLEVKERYQEIYDDLHPNHSKRKNIDPSVKMTPSMLKAYTNGEVFSYKGRHSTHPIFYAESLANKFRLDLNTVTLTDIEQTSTFPGDPFQEAVKFLKSKIEQYNPHLEKVPLEPTELQVQMGFIIQSPINDEEITPLDEDETDLDEEEKARAREFNQELKSIK